ncbi:MAG: PAN domain-containing protein [Candidatus Paceibacterota bacterium]
MDQDEIPLMEVVVLDLDDSKLKLDNDKLKLDYDKLNHNILVVKNKDNISCKSLLCKFFCNAFCICNIMWLFLMIGAILWALSEAGLYGEGVLRAKSVGELCGWQVNRPCAVGLRCIHEVCEKTPENVTWVVEDCKDPPPPKDCPPQTVNVQKVVSYFDYREYPNMYLKPKLNEIPMDKIPDIDYGACKEICSRNTTCHAVCYYGLTRECHLRSSKGIEGPIEAGGFWTCAIRT